ncbi:MAG: GNAT family N-acetyltransferase [Bacteroidota bacterium]|jgi:N-acetylglutamate synthase-like GNAT family acetyltransferase|nr:GNAT family N-acetyltransferase [Bacteroidota bacterium]
MIRQAESKDIESIKRLFKEVTGEESTDAEILNLLQQITTQTFESLYVFEYNASIVGALGFRVIEKNDSKSRYGEISVIVVSEKYQKKGLGKQLMEYAKNLALENKCSGTWLASGFGRKEKAHQFYRSRGYLPTGFKFFKHNTN